MCVCGRMCVCMRACVCPPVTSVSEGSLAYRDVDLFAYRDVDFISYSSYTVDAI